MAQRFGRFRPQSAVGIQKQQGSRCRGAAGEQGQRKGKVHTASFLLLPPLSRRSPQPVPRSPSLGWGYLGLLSQALPASHRHTQKGALLISWLSLSPTNWPSRFPITRRHATRQRMLPGLVASPGGQSPALQCCISLQIRPSQKISLSRIFQDAFNISPTPK